VQEAEESPSVEAVARKRLVETNRLRTLVCVSGLESVVPCGVYKW
jgi:hypothetical protein